MYRVFKSIKERMSDLLTANSDLTADVAAGSKEISVDNTAPFDVKALNDYYGTVMISDDNTTGEIGLDGLPEGTEFIKVSHVSGDRVFFQTPLQNSWSVADGAKITRAPNEMIVQDVIIGDIRVESSFPIVCVVPVAKQIDWWTLSGTHEAISVDFIVYSTDLDTQTGTEAVMKLTDVVQHILMNDLHVNLDDCEYRFERTSKSIVSNVDYTTIQKGSEFLQASRLNWKADLYKWMLFVTLQSGVDTFPPGAPRCDE